VWLLRGILGGRIGFDRFITQYITGSYIFESEKMVGGCMAVNRCSDTFVDEFVECGYTIERGMFSLENCDRLISVANELAKRRNEGWRPLMQPHREESIFWDALSEPLLTSRVSSLVDGAVDGLQSEFFFSPPGTRGFAKHQDNFFVEAPAGAFASAWIALTDITQHNGGLVVWPGTNREGLLQVRKIAEDGGPMQDPNSNNEETIVPLKYHSKDIIVAKGDVVFIDGWLVHASHINHAKANRPVLLCTYIRKGCSFRAGRYAKREAIPLA